MIVALFFTSFLLADDSQVFDIRSSSVSLSMTQSSSDYKDQSGNLGIGINSEWLLSMSYFESDSGVSRTGKEELVSTEYRAGVDYQKGDFYGIGAEAIYRKDPYELLAYGAGVQANYGLHTLWKGELLTDIAIKVESIRYQQQIKYTGALSSFTVDRDVTQRLFDLMIRQEVNRWLMISAQIRRYNYTEGINRLSLTTARRQTAFSSGRNSYGLPDREQELAAKISYISWVHLNVAAGRSQLATDETEIKSRRSNLVFFWRDFDFSVEYSYSDFGSTSGDDSDIQEFYALGLGYQF